MLRKGTWAGCPRPCVRAPPSPPAPQPPSGRVVLCVSSLHPENPLRWRSLRRFVPPEILCAGAAASRRTPPHRTGRRSVHRHGRCGVFTVAAHRPRAYFKAAAAAPDFGFLGLIFFPRALFMMPEGFGKMRPVQRADLKVRGHGAAAASRLRNQDPTPMPAARSSAQTKKPFGRWSAKSVHRHRTRTRTPN